MVIVEGVRRVHSDGRPRTVDGAAGGFGAHLSLELGDDPEGTLLDLFDSDDLPLDDNRYVDLPSLLAGPVFRQRLTSTEVKGRFPSWGPD